MESPSPVPFEPVTPSDTLRPCENGLNKSVRSASSMPRHVTAISQAGARRSAQAASALTAARRSGEGQRRRAQAILRAREGAAGCADADALILKSAGAGDAP